MNSSEDTISDEGVEGQMKPVLLWSNPDYVINPAQVGYSHPILARAPYPFDPYFSGILTAYGPQPPVMGMAPTRVPLPLDLAEDGPIYVNAKQYHGILRRRQSRARLEAQNKLVKYRKPYLHESRHLHALNRVRGSGGRFLSKKKNQQSDPNQSTTNHCMPDQDSRKFHEKKVALRSESPHSMFGENVQATTHSNIMIACDTNSLYHQQTDRRFSGISPHMSGAMQCSGRLLHGGTQHFASIVQ